MEQQKVRLDKWLWAARFYKTRGLARDAIDGGKVHYNGARVKASRHIELNAEVQLVQGFDRKTVHIMKIHDRRGPAPEAQKLYQETAKSIEVRETKAQERKLVNMHQQHERPTKRDRRQLDRFKNS